MPDIGYSLRNQSAICSTICQTLFFVVGCWLFYFCNRLRHKGLLLLVGSRGTQVCWVWAEKIPILMDGVGVLFVGILAKFAMMFSFKFQSFDHVSDPDP